MSIVLISGLLGMMIRVEQKTQCLEKVNQKLKECDFKLKSSILTNIRLPMKGKITKVGGGKNWKKNKQDI